MNKELYHYGIPGMKWGIRRFQNPDGTLTEKGRKRYKLNDKYKDNQVNRDVDVYGEGGMKRINRRMNEGHTLQGARSLEAERAAGSARTAQSLRRGTTFVGTVLGSYAAHVAINKLSERNPTVRAVNDMFGTYGHMVISGFIGTAIGRAAGAGAGAAYMTGRGYNPRKTWRYT